MVWAEIEFIVHVALPKRPMNRFQPVIQSRKQALRACCPKIYILCLGVFNSKRLVTGIHMKKGNQHTTNIPITKHKVMADLKERKKILLAEVICLLLTKIPEFLKNSAVVWKIPTPNEYHQLIRLGFFRRHNTLSRILQEFRPQSQLTIAIVFNIPDSIGNLVNFNFCRNFLHESKSKIFF